jgi:hypothetical protein
MKIAIAIIVLIVLCIGCKGALPKRKMVEDKVIDLYLKIVCGDGKPSGNAKTKSHDTTVQKPR